MGKHFTETWLRSLEKKPPAERTDYTEPGRRGFMLRHWPGGERTFVVRYQRDGKQRIVTLGSFPSMNLERAHAEHAEVRQQLSRGLDPITERESAKRVRETQHRRDAVADAVTVRNVIAEWAWHYARRERKRPREALRLLKVYVAGPWKGRPVRELVKRDAVLLLDRIKARGSLIMANRIRDLAAQCFAFAIERDLTEVNPFAGVGKPGGKEQAKERNLSADELRAFWCALDAPSTDIEMSRTVRAALKLILVTAQRPGEVAGARWEEFSLDAPSPAWLIPAERSKNGKPHEVPLSDLALELLTELRDLQGARPRPHVAPSRLTALKFDAPMDTRVLSRALRNNIDDSGELFGLAPFTPHDLRRSAASQMTALGVPRLLVGKVLNHSERDDITSVYDRHDYAAEKRAALQRWAENVRSIIVSKRINVIGEGIAA
jgi:integrase